MFVTEDWLILNLQAKFVIAIFLLRFTRVSNSSYSFGNFVLLLFTFVGVALNIALKVSKLGNPM